MNIVQPGMQMQPGMHPGMHPGMQPGRPLQMMPVPPSIPGIPPGLEYLSQIDQLIIKQQVEVVEALIGFETGNRYKVVNGLGQIVYFATEQSGCCARICLSNMRPFDMSIVDNFGRQVIHLRRPCRCDSCLCFCCLQVVEVYAPPGQLIGHVRQLCNPCKPSFVLQDHAGQDLLYCRGPCCCVCECLMMRTFTVFGSDNHTEVGRITKQWSGLLKEIFTDADNFGIVFPMDLDVRFKALLLALTFLIDFMYYEDKDNESGANVLSL